LILRAVSCHRSVTSLTLSLFALALLSASACSKSQSGNGTHSDASTRTSTAADSGSMSTDGFVFTGDVGMLGPSCSALAACCPTLSGSRQSDCVMTYSAANESACTAALSSDHAVGLCTNGDGGAGEDAGAQLDGGGAGGDAGPPGQACMTLLGCCGSVPSFLTGQCMSVAASGNDMQCQQILGLVMTFGITCESGDGGMMDAETTDTGTVSETTDARSRGEDAPSSDTVDRNDAGGAHSG
jgi:hypothetical protein